jgi:hypothetical protein
MSRMDLPQEDATAGHSLLAPLTGLFQNINLLQMSHHSTLSRIPNPPRIPRKRLVTSVTLN